MKWKTDQIRHSWYEGIEIPKNRSCKYLTEVAEAKNLWNPRYPIR